MEYQGRRAPLLHQEITGAILACAFDVINELGPGFLESVYEKSLLLALRQKGLEVEAQRPIDVVFRGQLVGHFCADLLVANKVIIEIKAIRSLAPEHMAQVINYLKATGIEVGLLINFGTPRLEYKRLTRHATLDPTPNSQNGDTLT